MTTELRLDRRDTAGKQWGHRGLRRGLAVHCGGGGEVCEGYTFPGVSGRTHERSEVMKARVTGLSPSKRDVENPRS